MIGKKQLLALLADLESDRVEKTTSTTDTQKFCQAVCAFANDLAGHRLPGYLLIGVKDDGSLSGLKVTDQLLQNLAAIRTDGNVLPTPALTVRKFALPGGEVAVVEVQPATLPPVRFENRIHVRIGPRKATASEQEERILIERRIATAHTFDVRPCLEASLDDLALGQFDTYHRAAVAAEVLAANHRDLRQQLAALRMFDLVNNCPTHAAILLFGNNPRYFFPCAYIQYLRMPAADLTDIPEDQTEISGDIVSVMRELELRIKVITQTGMRPEHQGSLKEVLQPSYPGEAIRELITNALLHRDYQSNTPIRFYVFSDHIEIHNPGGLYGEAARNFPNNNSYRNPVIADALKSLGYINRFGYGIQRANKLLENNNNPPAQFEYTDLGFMVKIFRREN